MSQFVLVHGAWLGAWCWRRVLPLLRSAGHDAYAVTLTGTGDRSHLLSAAIRLRTHIQDVLSLIVCEEMDEVVLVGHSYSGMVITGVADALMQRQPSLIRHLIYLDAVTPLPGESWSSQHAPETVSSRIKAAMDSGGVFIPAPDANIFGLDGPDRDWVNRRQTPHPFGVYRDPLSFDAERIGKLPRTFVDCTSPALPTIAIMRQRVRQNPGWRVEELATGHLPMISMPKELARILLSCKAS